MGDCRWRPSRGDGTLISLSDYLALGSIVALAVIHTGGMVPVVGDTHRDLPGALPTRAIISLEGNLINSTVTMLATLGAERNMAVWTENGVRGSCDDNHTSHHRLHNSPDCHDGLDSRQAHPASPASTSI